MGAALRAVGLVALGVVVVVAALAVAPRIVYACICVPPPLPHDTADVDVAFVGRPVAEDYDEESTGLVIEFEVDRVYKGSVGRRVEIRSTQTNCGIHFGEWEDWRDENRYWTRAMRITAKQSDDGVLQKGLCTPHVTRRGSEEMFGSSGYPPDGSIDPQTPDDDPAPANGGVDAAASDVPSSSSDPRDRDSVDATTEDAPSDASPQVAAPGISEDVEATSPDAEDAEASPIGALASTLVVSVAAALAVWLLLARRRARRSPPPG